MVTQRLGKVVLLLWELSEGPAVIEILGLSNPEEIKR